MEDTKKKYLLTAARFLVETPMCFIATIDGARPKVRPFQFMFEQDGRLWFGTSKSKDVYRQLRADPAVQICAVRAADMLTFRLDADVRFEERQDIKERILEEYPLTRALYASAEDPTSARFLWSTVPL